MKSGSWASYQSALPPEARSCGERDDEPEPVGRHDHEGPSHVVVEWFVPLEYDETMTEYDPTADTHRQVVVRMSHDVPVGRWFPAERWAWKHAMAWRDAMARKFGHATIEEVF
jgi:hypothetical protein